MTHDPTAAADALKAREERAATLSEVPVKKQLEAMATRRDTRQKTAALACVRTCACASTRE